MMRPDVAEIIAPRPNEFGDWVHVRHIPNSQLMWVPAGYLVAEGVKDDYIVEPILNPLDPPPEPPEPPEPDPGPDPDPEPPEDNPGDGILRSNIDADVGTLYNNQPFRLTIKPVTPADQINLEVRWDFADPPTPDWPGSWWRWGTFEYDPEDDSWFYEGSVSFVPSEVPSDHPTASFRADVDGVLSNELVYVYSTEEWVPPEEPEDPADE